jgi:O2-independent ubiquinone biosynthesis protein UbiV
MNGVRTLSDTYASAAFQIDALRNAGVSALRLSPQSTGFTNVCDLYRQLLDGKVDGAHVAAALGGLGQEIRLSDGFLTGKSGVEWSENHPPNAPQ